MAQKERNFIKVVGKLPATLQKYGYFHSQFSKIFV